MPFLWFSAGLASDFDGVTNANQALSDLQKTGVCRTGVALASSSFYDNWAYKILPYAVTETWSSIYAVIQNNNIPHVGAFGTTYDDAHRLYHIALEGNKLKAYCRISGIETAIATGNTVFSTGTSHQIEVHYKRDNTQGIMQVWIDGILEIDFSGNTGAAADVIGAFGVYLNNYSASEAYASEFICTDKGRIGKKRMQLMYLSGAGDTNTAEGFMDVLGNNSTTSATSVKSGTWIIPSPTKAGGTLKTVSFKLSANDTVKIGIFTKNASSVKFTPDAARQATVACLAGVVTLNSGNELPAWNIAAGEYIGIYTATGTLIGSTAYDYGDGDGRTVTNWYSYAGDAFSAATEQSYSTSDAYTWLYAYAQYMTSTNILHVYNNNIGVVTERPWQESKRYMSMSADGQEFLNNCTDLTDVECTAVNALKVTVRAEAGTSITNGQLSIKIGGTTTYSDVIAMPTVVNKRHNIFEGNWSKANINALQIGFKARS